MASKKRVSDDALLDEFRIALTAMAREPQQYLRARRLPRVLRLMRKMLRRKAWRHLIKQ